MARKRRGRGRLPLRLCHVAGSGAGGAGGESPFAAAALRLRAGSFRGRSLCPRSAAPVGAGKGAAASRRLLAFADRPVRHLCAGVERCRRSAVPGAGDPASARTSRRRRRCVPGGGDIRQAQHGGGVAPVRDLSAPKQRATAERLRVPARVPRRRGGAVRPVRGVRRRAGHVVRQPGNGKDLPTGDRTGRRRVRLHFAGRLSRDALPRLAGAPFRLRPVRRRDRNGLPVHRAAFVEQSRVVRLGGAVPGDLPAWRRTRRRDARRPVLRSLGSERITGGAASVFRPATRSVSAPS